MHKNKSAAGIYRKEESHTSNDLDFVLPMTFRLYNNHPKHWLHRNDKNTKKDNS